MITALFIYDAKGDILISKLYKEGVKRNISDVFRIQVINSHNKNNGPGTNKDVRSPVLTLGSTSFIYIRSSLLWICAVSRSNQDCSAILEFLYNLESLLKVMLIGGTDTNTMVKKPLTDEMIVNNFNLIFELLDEVVEFGYPTNLELSYLKNFITSIPTNDKIFKLPNNVLKTAKIGSSTPSIVSSKKLMDLNITWRSPGIKYRRNEIFLNVEEKVNVLMNSEGEILRSYVDGVIKMKTHLTGMPECRFGLSDDSFELRGDTLSSNGSGVMLEDCKFHQCVELNKFDSERVIQFVPPDGDFQLMSYHCLQNINLPFEIYPEVTEIGKLKLLYKLRLKSFYPAKLPATNVQIKIPTPKGVLKNCTTCSSGKAKFHPEEHNIIWKFNKLFGGHEHLLTAEIELAENTNELGPNQLLNWSRPPIKVEFMLDMFSCSGLAVKFLKVQEKTNYRTVKWVKYSSQAGSYDIRY